MDNKINPSDSLKKVSVNSMITYFRGLSAESQGKILNWAKMSKRPDANINKTNPSDWEKNLKMMFSQLNPQEQAEVVRQATIIFNDKAKK